MLEDMVRTRLKAAVDGWKLYRIGADLDRMVGQTDPREYEPAIQRLVHSALTRQFLAAGQLHGQDRGAGQPGRYLRLPPRPPAGFLHGEPLMPIQSPVPLNNTRSLPSRHQQRLARGRARAPLQPCKRFWVGRGRRPGTIYKRRASESGRVCRGALSRSGPGRTFLEKGPQTPAGVRGGKAHPQAGKMRFLLSDNDFPHPV